MGFNFFQILQQKAPITESDITIFFRQFSTLISSGIPLIKCCDLLEKSQQKITFRLIIYAIKRDIFSGKNLFYSLRRHHLYFDALTCQLIQIGEETGKLDYMLTLVASNWEKKLAFKQQLKQALFYPCLIFFTALLITIGMLLFVIPKFAELFQDWPEQLPLITRLIFYLSTNLQNYLGLLFFLLITITILIVKIKSIKQFFYLTIIHSPFIKHVTRKITITRFVRTLSITFAAGIPIIKGLKLTKHVSKQNDFKEIISILCNKISAGHQLHQAMESTFYFPLLVTQMVKIGEESGNLAPMLNKVGELIESDIEQLITYFSRFLETLIMIVLGALIGGLVVSMYLPIFKLGSVL